MTSTMTDEFRAAIRAAKADIKASGVDVAASFAAIDSMVEEQIGQIEAEVDAGISPIPVCDYGDVASGSVAPETVAKITQRGAVILRNTFARERVQDWNDMLMAYVAENDYFERQKAKQGMDQYFSNLSSSRPQIFGLYWSRPQMEARTSEELAVARK